MGGIVRLAGRFFKKTKGKRVLLRALVVGFMFMRDLDLEKIECQLLEGDVTIEACWREVYWREVQWKELQ